jgi:16S rRNA (cytidine1402-2'-O)-methyltransferase
VTNTTDRSLKPRNQALKNGTLYVVATPIGNMKDISLRAIDVLKAVDLVLCENTFNSQKLLSNFAIHTKTKQFTDFSDDKYVDMLLDMLRKGQNIALISDAGTPMISDPGYKLIQAAQENAIFVTAIPGASTITAIASISPIPMDKFYFYGFLPHTKEHLKNELRKMETLDCSIVFFESPRRVVDALNAIIDVLGDRKIFLARELTKLYEQHYYGTASNVIGELATKEIKGEIAFVMEGATILTAITDADLKNLLSKMLTNMSIKDAVTELSKEYKLPKKHVYNLALKVKE